MKNKTKQRLALLLTVLMLLSLAACGGKPAGGDGGAHNDQVIVLIGCLRQGGLVLRRIAGTQLHNIYRHVRMICGKFGHAGIGGIPEGHIAQVPADQQGDFRCAVVNGGHVVFGVGGRRRAGILPAVSTGRLPRRRALQRHGNPYFGQHSGL